MARSTKSDLEAISLEWEKQTGYDSIPTIERVYGRVQAYVCVWPDCTFARRDAVEMWCHVHTAHGGNCLPPDATMTTKQEPDERWTFDLEHEKKHAQWAWDTNQESLAYCLDGFIVEHERLTAEVDELRAEIQTWGQIWNDEAMLAARVEALRDGTAQTC